jgi:hypothetical protein
MRGRVRLEGWNRPDDFKARFDLTAARPGPQPRITRARMCLGPIAAVGFVVGQRHLLARRRERLNNSRFAARHRGGLSGEWTIVGRPSTEVLHASWRQAAPPGGAMELLRFALGASPLDSRHRMACRGQRGRCRAAGLDAVFALRHARQSGAGPAEPDSANVHRSSRRTGWSRGTSTRTIRTPSGSSIHISTSPQSSCCGPRTTDTPAASSLRRSASTSRT